MTAPVKSGQELPVGAYLWQVRSAPKNVRRSSWVHAISVRYRWLRAPDLNLHPQTTLADVRLSQRPAKRRRYVRPNNQFALAVPSPMC
jgi:hypothetical protein